MLTSEQFDRTRKLALQLAGIELYDRHRELLAIRSRRLRLPGLSPHLRAEGTRGGWISHPQGTDQTHVDTSRDRSGRQRMSVS
jgi:hypothetical protein